MVCFALSVLVNAFLRHASDHLRHYLAIHERIIEHKPPPVKVCFVPTHLYRGFADKLFATVASLTVAMLTDSALVINWPHIDTYVLEPLPHSLRNFTAPNGLNVNHRPEELVGLSTLSTNAGRRNVSTFVNMSIPSSAYRLFYDDHHVTFLFQLCANPAYYDKLIEYGLITKKTVDISREVLRNSLFSTDKKFESVLSIGIYIHITHIST